MYTKYSNQVSFQLKDKIHPLVHFLNKSKCSTGYVKKKFFHERKKLLLHETHIPSCLMAEEQNFIKYTLKNWYGKGKFLLPWTFKSQSMMMMMMMIWCYQNICLRIYHFHFHPNLTYVSTHACMPARARTCTRAHTHTHTCN
jgi:hypothetical protein